MARPKEFDIDRVISLASEYFVRHGYAATTVRDLADYMGISRSSLYATFGSKYDLYLVVLKQAYDLELASHPGPWPDECFTSAPAVRAFLSDWVEQVVSGMPCHTSLIVRALIEDVPHDAKIRQLANDYLHSVFEVNVRRIAAGQQAGAISTRFPASTLSNLFNSTCSNIAIHYAVYQDRQLVEDIAAATASVFEVENS